MSDFRTEFYFQCTKLGKMLRGGARSEHLEYGSFFWSIDVLSNYNYMHESVSKKQTFKAFEIEKGNLHYMSSHTSHWEGRV